MRWNGLLGMLALALALPAEAQFRFKYDVPYVPTPHVVVEEMLRIADVKADDFLIDLGSGDGRIPIAAARKFGARAVGVDLDAELVAESIDNAVAAGVGDRVQFLRRDLFAFDISQATVVTLYLIPSVNMKLRQRLFDQLRPGTRVVSHDFEFGDWKPDAKSMIRKSVLMWIVPAYVAGRWRMSVVLPAGERSYDIEIRQHHQEVDGVVRQDRDKRVASLWNPKLEGDRLSFVIVDDSGEVESNLYCEGRVDGDAMTGTLRRGVGADQMSIKWRAVRVQG